MTLPLFFEYLLMPSACVLLAGSVLVVVYKALSERHDTALDDAQKALIHMLKQVGSERNPRVDLVLGRGIPVLRDCAERMRRKRDRDYMLGVIDELEGYYLLPDITPESRKALWNLLLSSTHMIKLG